MAQISGETIQQLLLILRPLMWDKQQRQTYLVIALGNNATVLHRLVWDVPADDFIIQMVKELVAFGEISPNKPALCALLEVIYENVGVDIQPKIDNLLRRIKEELKKQNNKTTSGVHWDRSVHTLKGHSDPVYSVAISPDGQIIASGSGDRTIKLWKAATVELLATLTGHSSTIVSVAFSPDGQTLASASNMEFQDGNIKLWDVGAARLRQTFGSSLLSLRTSCVAFSPDGQTLATGHFDAAIRLWHFGTGKVLRTLRGHGWDVNCVTFSRDGRFLVSGGVDGAIMIWDWRSSERMLTLNRPSDVFHSFVSWLDRSVGSIKSVAITFDGQMIASGGSSASDSGLANPPIKLWDSNTGKELRILYEDSKTLNEKSKTVYSVAFSPNGKILASGDGDSKIKIWNVKTGDLLQILEHLGPVNSVAFSPDGKTLVSGSDDATIKVWRVSF